MPSEDRVCCCISSKLGVLHTSLFSFLSSGFLAIVLWNTLNEMDHQTDDSTSVITHAKKVTAIFGVIFTMISLLSLIGLIGSIIESLALVRAFMYATWVIFAAACVSTGLLFYELWSGNQLTTICVKFGADSYSYKENCNTRVSQGIKAVATITIAHELIIHFFRLKAVRKFTTKLEGK